MTENEPDTVAASTSNDPEASGLRSLTGRVARGAAWSFAGTLVARLLAFAGSVYVTRMLGRAATGQFGMIQSTTRLFYPLAGRGLGGAATKYVAELRHRQPERASRILALTLMVGLVGSLATSAALWLGAGVLSAQSGLDPGMLRLAAVLLFVTSIAGIVTDALTGFEAFRGVTVVGLVEGAVSLAASLILVWKFGLVGAVTAFIVGFSASLIVATASLVRLARESGFSLGISGAWSERSILWRYSAPDVLISLTMALVEWYVRARVMSSPGGDAEMGAVDVALQWRNLAMYAPGALIRVALPILSQVHGAGSARDFQRAAVVQICGLWIVLVAVCVGVAGASPFILKLYGREFRGGELLLMVHAIIAALQSLAGLLSAVLASQARTWTLWLAILFGALAFLLFGFLWTPAYGGMGYSLALLLFYVAQLVGMLLAIGGKETIIASAAPCLLTSAACYLAYLAAIWNPWAGLVLAPPISLLAALGCWFAFPAWTRSSLANEFHRRLARFKRMQTS